MERFGKADAIFGGDWHLMEHTPVSRTDDYPETVFRKLHFISELQKVHGCPVYHSGDLFDHWKPSPWLIAKAAKHLPEQFYSTYGNHDLPGHSFDERERCGLFALAQASNKVNALEFGYWNYDPAEGHCIEIKGRKILVWHKCVFQIKEEWMSSIDSSHARKLLKKYPEYDVIVTGDNHKPFVEEYNGKYLVNCGSLGRITAAQIKHRPAVYLWYADDNKVVPVYLPIEKNVLSTEHLQQTKERDVRISSFLEGFKEWKSSLDFEENLKRYEQENNPDPEIMKIVYNSIDNGAA